MRCRIQNLNKIILVQVCVGGAGEVWWGNTRPKTVSTQPCLAWLGHPTKTANKIMSYNGRLLVRRSGTEPKIRIMGESHNKNLILKCIKIIKRSIK